MKSKLHIISWSAPYETVTDIYCITILFLFPLFPGFSGYQNITFSKYVFLLTVTALWLFALAVLRICGKKCTLQLKAAQWAALAFLAVSVLSALCSPFPDRTLFGAGRYDGLLTTLLYGLIFLGVSVFTEPKRIHAYAFGAAVTLCCLVAVLQLFGKNPLGLYPENLRWQDAGILYSGAYLGTIGNTNLLDAMLALAIPFCFCEALKERRCFLLPLLLSLPIVMLAGGSGLHFSLCAFVCAALLLLPRRKTVRIVCAVLCISLLIAALAVLWLWRGQSGTLYELSRMLHGSFEDSFGSSRIMIWRSALTLLPERPLLGGGPGTLAARLDITFSRYVPESGATLQSYVDNAHNIYLAYLTNTGILGLLSYLAFLLCCACCALRRMKKNVPAAALALSVFCASVHAFFGLGLFLTEPLYFLMLGLCSSVNSSYEEKSACDKPIRSA